MDENAILRPGDTCWRLEHAERVAFLVDGAAYFSAARDAIRRARQSVLLLAWDIDSRVRLTPDGPDDDLPPGFGDFLNQVVADTPGLHAYILTWDFAMIYALEREWLPVYKLGWRTHRRLHFHMDGAHPTGASHHQKVLVIDDQVGFVGGLDFTKRRWDTPEHRAEHPRRVDPDGIAYGPFHDVQMAVDGPVTEALGKLSRERWYRATGKRLPAPAAVSGHSVWPVALEADVTNVHVGIARTEPAYDGRRRVHEVERLFLESIAQARHLIYIENQYFTSHAIADALSRRLWEADGPEVVLLLPFRSSGWLEQRTMDVRRAGAIQRLRNADRFDRLRVLYPFTKGAQEAYVNLHSKVCLVDERFAHIGSANLSNRSMGLDTECDLAFEAETRDHARAIAALRSRLLAEHLGRDAAEVQRTFNREGSLIRTLDFLAGPGRGLRPLTIDKMGPNFELTDSRLFDPEKPMDAEQLVDQLLPQEAWMPASRRLLGLAALLALVILAGVVLRGTEAGGWVWREALGEAAAWLRVHPLGFLAIMGGFLLGGLLIIPVTLLIALTVFLTGPVPGAVYALFGTVFSAALTFGIGRALGRNRIRRLASQRLNRFSRGLVARGVLAVVAVRLVPVAPFSVVNVMAGASAVPFGPFLVGTLIGMAPGVFAIALFVDRLEAALREPHALNFGLLIAVVVLVALGAVVIKHWVAGFRKHPRVETDA